MQFIRKLCTYYLQTIISAIKKSLLTGTSFLRVAGNIYTPKIYLVQSMNFSIDRNNQKYFQFLNSSISLNYGNNNNIAVENYKEHERLRHDRTC